MHVDAVAAWAEAPSNARQCSCRVDGGARQCTSMQLLHDGGAWAVLSVGRPSTARQAEQSASYRCFSRSRA
jgi:hypothetical protein